MKTTFHSIETQKFFTRLDALNLNQTTKNGGVHIFFSFEHWRFDVRPTTHKLHITNTRNKMKKSYSGEESVKKAIAWYFE